MNKISELRKALDERFPGNYALEVAADQIPILMVIDRSFMTKTRAQRLSRVQPLLDAAELKDGIVDLYTPEEAEARGITLPDEEAILAPSSWEAAVTIVESGQTVPERDLSKRKMRRIVFYSYKGGVGRTTALVHTAFHLARSDQRVVLIDMDIEAPGLHTVLPRGNGQAITAGLVDYLWERQIRPIGPGADQALETCLVEGTPGGRSPISYPVEDPISRAQIQVIPAGAIGSNFVRRLATLSSQDMLARPDDAWSLFEKDLAEQLEPDAVLIDARTGLGEWGGLSLLRLADEAFIVLYPSAQNAEGVVFIRHMLRSLGGIPVHLVLSPVPEGPIGRDLVTRLIPRLDLQEGDERPLEIHYHPSIAAALQYPVESAMADYARLANLILETDTENKLEASIQRIDRWKVIESLKFPERDAKAIAASAFELFFQKTSDFDKFLDDARWVVRGRKGTGKSTLFHLFVEHHENAAKRAKGKLEGIDILAGHGPAPGATFRPTTDIFDTIARTISTQKYDWLSLWRVYAVVRLFSSPSVQSIIDSLLRRSELLGLRQHLQKVFPREPDSVWRSAHTKGLMALLDEPLSGLCRDIMSDLNRALAAKDRKIWLLYDDLDQDIKEETAWQGEALGGLLRLAYDSNNQDLHNLRFKVFLREDIWAKLVFTNKSHFGDPRTLLLQWKIDDFLRLTYRLTTGGSPEFKSLTEREFPLTEAEVDTATEEQLRQALAPLWGLNQQKRKHAFAARWVYSRMTDASGNTYPRSLTVLLNAAREEELRVRSDKLAPKDRLLSPRSLQAGLKTASIERVNALKNEYPALKPFLEEVEKTDVLRSQFRKNELRVVWERTSKKKDARFEQFAAQLVAVGLIQERRVEKFDYAFASLYIDGLSVKRVQGEQK